MSEYRMDPVDLSPIEDNTKPLPREEKYFPAVNFDHVLGVTNFTRNWPPVRTETKHLKKGEYMAEGFRSLCCDILMEQDVPIPMRDGATIYGDIYRPEGVEKDVPIILVWAAYGKQGAQYIYDMQPDRAFIRMDRSSGLDTFEGPDPAYWVNFGYAVVNVDPRGSVNSDGECMYNCNVTEAKDVYDTVEFLAALPWTNGKVGMIGNSWLAMTQWWAAAEQPPHLTAIAPWEGHTDSYRDLNCRGGIPCGQFYMGLLGTVPSRHYVEQIGMMAEEYPFLNDYWEKERRVDFYKVTIPAYVVGSWTSNVHPLGSLRGFALIASKEKWLRVHNTQEWYDQHTPKYRSDLRKFYDHYLKGIDNGWEKTPKVRYSLLDPSGVDKVDLTTTDWPIPNTQYTKLYLNAKDMTMSLEKPDEAGAVTYAVGEEADGFVKFRFQATQEMYLCGYYRSHFVMSTDSGNDIDLFFYIHKEDEIGTEMHPTVLAVDYMGAEGRLRASHRKIANDDLYDFRHEHKYEEPLEPGQKVLMDTSTWPDGLVVREGETLVLAISSKALQHFEFPTPPVPTRNEGNHTVYTGGDDASYLEIPMISLS